MHTDLVVNTDLDRLTSLILEKHKDGIMVAEYWKEMPPKQQLQQKLHELLIEAKERIARNTLNQ